MVPKAQRYFSQYTDFKNQESIKKRTYMAAGGALSCWEKFSFQKQATLQSFLLITFIRQGRWWVKDHSQNSRGQSRLKWPLVSRATDTSPTCLGGKSLTRKRHSQKIPVIQNTWFGKNLQPFIQKIYSHIDGNSWHWEGKDEQPRINLSI